MKYRNNLNDNSENSWFMVTKPFNILIAIGNYPTNSYFGSSPLYGTLYESIILNTGDLLADLFGGVFALHNGKMYQAKMKLSDKHPFEKVYTSSEEVFPVECLEKCNAPQSDLKYVNKLPLVTTPTSFYKRNIDSIKK